MLSKTICTMRPMFTELWLRSGTSLLSVDWGQECTFADKERLALFPWARRTQYRRSICSRAFNGLPEDVQRELVAFYKKVWKCRDDANRLCYPRGMIWSYLINCVQRLKQENIQVSSLLVRQMESGYEEAAGQGICMLINAALNPLIRNEAAGYIRWWLTTVTKGNHWTLSWWSRAEYRLILRHDNADMRLQLRWGVRLV